MLVGLNAFEMVGVTIAVTVRVAVLLAAPATGVCVVVTPEVVFGWEPGVLLVTPKITVHEVLAPMVIPLKPRAVAPAVNVPGVVPMQLPETAPPTALILLSVSENAAPVRTEALLFDKVTATLEVPPDRIEVGLKDLEIVGAARTRRVAVLLTAPAVAVWVVVTPEVVLFCDPGTLLVTLKITVQPLLAGIVIPVKLNAV